MQARNEEHRAVLQLQEVEIMRSLYDTSAGFKQYVDRYCQKHEIDRETAFTHSVIRNAFEYYENAEKGKISSTEIKVGCGCVDLEDKSC